MEMESDELITSRVFKEFIYEIDQRFRIVNENMELSREIFLDLLVKIESLEQKIEKGLIMTWKKFSEEKPYVHWKDSRRILILVNGVPELCDVFTNGCLFIRLNCFNYTDDGFRSDPRFAEPTHWMEIPELPKD
jgi:hypothetical protein